MRPQIKLATCCYCGARTMLKPTARGGHELACGSCGAPLHEMKWLKLPEPAPAAPKRLPRAQGRPYRLPEKPKKLRKGRKPVWRRALEEIWDEVEDIFD